MTLCGAPSGLFGTFRYFDESSQSVIDSRGIGKEFGDLRLKHNDIRALAEPYRVFASDASREIVLRPHVFSYLLHT
jgi:hypothetical protein